MADVVRTRTSLMKRSDLAAGDEKRPARLGAGGQTIHHSPGYGGGESEGPR